MEPSSDEGDGWARAEMGKSLSEGAKLRRLASPRPRDHAPSFPRAAPPPCVCRGRASARRGLRPLGPSEPHAPAGLLQRRTRGARARGVQRFQAAALAAVTVLLAVITALLSIQISASSARWALRSSRWGDSGAPRPAAPPRLPRCAPPTRAASLPRRPPPRRPSPCRAAARRRLRQRVRHILVEHVRRVCQLPGGARLLAVGLVPASVLGPRHRRHGAGGAAPPPSRTAPAPPLVPAAPPAFAASPQPPRRRPRGAG